MIKDIPCENQPKGVSVHSSGRLFVANTDKLISFDGVTWRTEFVGKLNSAALKSDTNGSLLLGSFTGFGYFYQDEDERWLYNALSDSFSKEELQLPFVWEVIVTESKIIYVSENYLFLYQRVGKHYRLFKKIAFDYVQIAYHFKDSLSLVITISDNQDIIPFQLNEITGEITPLPENFKINNQFHAFNFWWQENLYSLDEKKGLHKLANNKTTKIPLEKEQQLLKSGIFDHFFIPKKELLLLFSVDDVYIYSIYGKLLYHLDKSSGLASKFIQNSYLDDLNNLWIITEKSIECFFLSLPYLKIDEQLGVESTIFDFNRFQNQYYFACNDGFFNLYPGGNLNFIPETKSQSWAIDFWHDSIILSNGNNGLKVIKDNKVIYSKGTQNACFFVQRHLKDHSLLFLCTFTGIMVLRAQDSVYKEIGKIPHFIYDVRRLVPRTGYPNKYWVTDSQNKQWYWMVVPETELNTAEDLKKIRFEPAPVQNKRNIVQKNGKTYFSDSVGIWIWNDQHQKLELLKASNTKFSLYNYDIDSKNRIWAFSESKIIQEKEIIDSFSLSFFNYSETLLEDTLRNGTWVYGGNLVGFVPNEKIILPKLTVFLSKLIAIGTDSTLVSQSLKQIPYQLNTLRFEPGISNFLEPKRNEFRYFLAGVDRSFTNWKSGSYTYVDLWEGDYVLTIQGRDCFGQVASTQVRFTIFPPWYRSTLAYFGYLLTFALLIWLVNRISRKTLINRNIRLEKIVAQRTDEILQQREEILQQKEEISAQKEELETILKHVELENKRKTLELEAAKSMQLAMLPKKIPQHPQFEIAWKMKTATEVGGDFFDYRWENSQSKLRILLADATDHGMKAALIVASARATFYASSPNLFQEMHQVIKQLNVRGAFIALTNLEIDFLNDQIVVSFNFWGMPPAILLRKQSTLCIHQSASPLGILAYSAKPAIKTQIQPNDLLFLFTDGLTEMRHHQTSEEFGIQNIQEILQKNNSSSAKEVITAFEQAIYQWSNDRLRDDISIMAIKFLSENQSVNT